MAGIREKIRQYILQEYLPDTDPGELTDDTELIDNGVLDSLARLRLRAFLEEEYDIELRAHELDFEHFSTIADIAGLVRSRTGDRPA